jgi:hypothetical protein
VSGQNLGLQKQQVLVFMKGNLYSVQEQKRVLLADLGDFLVDARRIDLFGLLA